MPTLWTGTGRSTKSETGFLCSLMLNIQPVEGRICCGNKIRIFIPYLYFTFNVKRYRLADMIKSFRCKETKELFGTSKTKKFTGIKDVAERKLLILHAATALDDLRSPPGNRLEALSGDRIGQHSIRINKQWRICFRWTDDGPEDVEITDYH